MRKLLVMFVLLAVFAWSQTAYGMGRIIVYKGTIKASKSLVDVNDTNSLVSTTVRGYWVINEFNAPGEEYNGELFSGSAVIYDPRTKYYKVIPGTIETSPYDPCKIVMLSYYPDDADGSMSFNVTGKGKLIKYTNTPGTAKGYTVTAFKGTGVLSNYDFFDPAHTYSGSVVVSLSIDNTYTRYFNANIGSYSNLDEIMDEIVADLTDIGWTEWPYNPGP
jgi:hypothetical protein